MQKHPIRVAGEFVTVILIVVFAVIALKPAQRTTGHYTLDHGRIIYDGQVFKNKFDGTGKLRLKNGDLYQGQFKDGRFNGTGSLKSHEGWKFSGHFVQGDVSGHGKLTTQKNKVYQGEFKDGNFKQTK